MVTLLLMEPLNVLFFVGVWVFVFGATISFPSIMAWAI